MSNENPDIDKFNIVKHIGKGSFSNVYLCKAELDSLLNDIYDYEKYYIIKQININVLVDKYMSNSKSEYRFQKMTQKKGNSNVSVNITPYSKNNIMVSSKSTEKDYYYYKLKGLIESEIDVLCMLSHSAIIKFNDYTLLNNIYYLNLEYCDKGDVYYMLKNENEEIDTDFIYEFTKQTSDGLAYMHTNDIIHRDIKLQNILVKTNYVSNTSKIKYKYVFKLSDFGFSCYDMNSLKNKKDSYDLDELLCKKYYKLCGTPYFMAPEIVLNLHKLENFTFYDENKKINLTEFYDKRIDIWSYGICLYELIMNKMPFSNIKNFKDLEKLYKNEDIQIYIDSKIDVITDITFNSILYMSLKVNPDTRCYIDDICNKIHNTNVVKKIQINDNEEEQNDSSFFDILKHIVSNPINTLQNTFSSLNSNNHNTNSNNQITNVKYSKQEIEKEVSTYKNDKKQDDKNRYSSYLMNSWEEINNSSSLMLKLSVQKGFLEWLSKK